MDRRGEYYTNKHGNRHEISFTTQQTTGWSAIILGILVALGIFFAWPLGVQYLWAALIALVGIWMVAAK